MSLTLIQGRVLFFHRHCPEYCQLQNYLQSHSSRDMPLCGDRYTHRHEYIQLGELRIKESVFTIESLPDTKTTVFSLCSYFTG